MVDNRPMVFVCCGQQTEDEINLAKDICKKVEDLTPFKPYFAEIQSTLEGLTANILEALNKSVGFIAVMHHRGTVTPPGDLIRTSVWVEQEIAIAAFIRQVLRREINVAAFKQKGIALEGMRAQLLLNPKEFEDSKEVLAHLDRILPTWKKSYISSDDSKLSGSIEYERVEINPHRHVYRLVVFIKNIGNSVIEKFHVDLEFPTALIDNPKDHPLFIQDRSNERVSFFRYTSKNYGNPLYPGDAIRAFNLLYIVDEEIYWDKQSILKEAARASFYIEGKKPRIIEKPIAQLQNY
jgi:hypothetical protein